MALAVLATLMMLHGIFGNLCRSAFFTSNGNLAAPESLILFFLPKLDSQTLLQFDWDANVADPYIRGMLPNPCDC